MDRYLKNSGCYRIPVINLGKYKEVTTVLKLITSISPKGAYSIFYFKPEKYTFFYALKDAIDHLLGIFFFMCYFQ